ncbi:O-antigen polysaccharide polymerase Wzy [Micrococcus luteus]|uniref:O-antigen polysaccharide polymerase Wzy n=1 Tax=Micrococcus luteus TaxID=1270 RepID=UPI0037F73ABA
MSNTMIASKEEIGARIASNRPGRRVETAPRGRSTTRRFLLLEGGFYLVLAAIFALTYQDAHHLSLQTLSTLGTLVAVYAYCRTVYLQPRGFWSFAALSLLVTLLFHLAALPEIMFLGYSTDETVELWIDNITTNHAVWLATSGVLAFLAGITLASPARFVRLPRGGATNRTAGRGRLGASDMLALVGLGLMLLFAFRWLRWAAGQGLLAASYGQYLAASEGVALQTWYTMIGLGLVLLCLAPRRWFTWPGFLVFLAFAYVGFPLGLRGEVLFPLAAAAAVLAFRLKMPSAVLATLLAIPALGVIAAISRTRNAEGLAGATAKDFSPLAALAEMGSSLRVLGLSLSWHEHQGLAYTAGLHYWVPARDLVTSLVFRASTPPATPETHMNQLVDQTAGQIGGSVMASAHHAFGVPGLILVMLVVGLFLGWVGRYADLSPFALAAVGVLAFGYQQHIRNDFSSVALTVIYGVGALLIAAVLTLLLREGRRGRRLLSTRAA